MGGGAAQEGKGRNNKDLWGNILEDARGEEREAIQARTPDEIAEIWRSELNGPPSEARLEAGEL